MRRVALGASSMKKLRELVVSVFGLGLLGASLAWRLTSTGKAGEVAGWSRNPATLEAAFRRGIITRACDSAEECASLGDVIVLAVPVRAMEELSLRIVRSVRPTTAVFDLGSTKSEIGATLSSIWGGRYAGFHPMAGKERGGLENAFPDLFLGSVCAVVPFTGTYPGVTALAEELALALGGCPLLIDADEHDAAVACISHLPLVISAALSLLAGGEMGKYPSLAALSAGGFRDTTRVAAGPAWLGADMVSGNGSQVRRLAEEFKRLLDELLSSDSEKLESRLSDAAAARDRVMSAKEEWLRGGKERQG